MACLWTGDKPSANDDQDQGRHMSSLDHNGRSQWYTLRPRRNKIHFAGYIFKCILLHENVWISIKISLKFIAKGPINNDPALVQIMAWRRPGDKPLFEPMIVSLLTHICLTRSQWVKSLGNHNRHSTAPLNITSLRTYKLRSPHPYASMA